MKNQPHPRKVLGEIIAKDPNLLQDRQRCEAYLRDMCPAYKREIKILIDAHREGVPNDLISSKLPPELSIQNISQKLQNNCGLSLEMSKWAVDSWAIALKIIGVSSTHSSGLGTPKMTKKHDIKVTVISFILATFSLFILMVFGYKYFGYPKFLSRQYEAHEPISTNLYNLESSFPQEQYSKYIELAKKNILSFPDTAHIRYSLGTNEPISLNNNHTTNLNNNLNLEAIGYLDASGEQALPFTKQDILQLIDELSDRMNNNSIQESDTVEVLSLVCIEANSNTIYLMKNISIQAILRDIVNSAVNEGLTFLESDIDLTQLEINQNSPSSNLMSGRYQ
ncbi:hypothetical protein [Arthrospira platensis]|jgi:hypothetical protein|uniref:Uncharacterized protein n=1 Tax=Limnospira platensis NIES-46 TaxID=1236695 RepID=A0A5M3TAP6_LIMPL|nr:hypothetical protein [Arthrospira platensis]AMW31087.1 PBS lyase [Arthrospira platensis YZ]KDR58592.1 PBS lyase [Arthrospira platensis str. Paraca]MBD2669109.1 PBS lyase [Arthrospira platensis FACHB-439]MBD2712364.1 PBS lyase [Arthrospira platensis FACHB-835]MDF2208489.1 PBS lyase [Arthrospira platensis NCB002]MDT9185343.1 PBS lyase [Limnospira sp. PMC 289.06]MDT9297563.1 PBS lyase [Arthrospira platensis PCC 7345]MDT9313022.1 PBS lyase [Limnospira sp. Paracas R14]QQW28984.1 PBS lyase [A